MVVVTAFGTATIIIFIGEFHNRKVILFNEEMCITNCAAVADYRVTVNERDDLHRDIEVQPCLIAVEVQPRVIEQEF